MREWRAGSTVIRSAPGMIGDKDSSNAAGRPGIQRFVNPRPAQVERLCVFAFATSPPRTLDERPLSPSDRGRPRGWTVPHHGPDDFEWHGTVRPGRPSRSSASMARSTPRAAADPRSRSLPSKAGRRSDPERWRSRGGGAPRRGDHLRGLPHLEAGGRERVPAGRRRPRTAPGTTM